jgi:hypothetical protein
VVRAVAEAMFSQDGEVEAERLDAHLDEVDAFVSNASRPLRAGLRIALFVVRVAPLLFFFRLRMIESLDVSDRVTILSRLERSRLASLSLAFIGWRTVMTLVFYEHPIELQSLGYAGAERHVYKRRLPTLVPTLMPGLMPGLVLIPVPSLVASSALPAFAAAAPPPAESGVRLREDGAGADAADDSGKHKVA